MDLFFDASVLPLPEVGHITAAFLQEKLHGTPARARSFSEADTSPRLQ